MDEKEKQIYLELLGIINEKKEEFDTLSKDIWSHPEVAFKEFYAVERQEKLLTQLKFKFEKPYDDLPTAYVATRETGTGGKCFALAAEYDALPGIGHGCGHNINCVNAVSGGWALAEYLERHNIPGKVIIFGTPAEEGGGGKVRMLKHGCLDNVDAVIMSHAGSNKIRHGAGSSSIHRFEVEFKGRASHAASNPWKGLNALDAQILLFNGVGLLRQQLEPAAILHGIITKGGDAVNVIPDNTVSLFSVRSTKDEIMDSLIEKFRHLVNGAAEMTGTKGEIREVSVPYRARKINYTLEEPFLAAMEAFGCTITPGIPDVGRGSSDFGDFTQVRPGGYPCTPVSLTPVAGHTVEKREACNTDYARDMCRKAGAAMAACGLRFLADPEFRDKVNREFSETK